MAGGLPTRNHLIIETKRLYASRYKDRLIQQAHCFHFYCDGVLEPDRRPFQIHEAAVLEAVTRRNYHIISARLKSLFDGFLLAVREMAESRRATQKSSVDVGDGPLVWPNNPVSPHPPVMKQ